MKLTFRYIFYVELYSGVVLFSLIFRVRVRVSYRVRAGAYLEGGPRGPAPPPQSPIPKKFWPCLSSLI